MPSGDVLDILQMFQDMTDADNLALTLLSDIRFNN